MAIVLRTFARNTINELHTFRIVSRTFTLAKNVRKMESRMTERDRLKKLLNEAFIKSDDNFGMPSIRQVTDYLVENGVIALPCKVGDQVFVVYGYEIQHASVYSMKIESEDDHFVFIIKCMVSQRGARFEKFIFGQTAFLTLEEAEKELEDMRKENEEK